MPQALHILDQVSVVVFATLAVLAARSDWSRFTIPNHLSLAIAGLWAVHAALLLLQGQSPATIAWSAGIALSVFLVALGLFAANLLGGGDVKLLAAASLWAAPDWVPQFIVTVTVSGAVLGLAFLVPAFGNHPQEDITATGSTSAGVTTTNRLKRKTPYGTAIAVGCAAVAFRLLDVWPVGG